MDPDVAYGPDDPGYGPPGPDWYRRTAEAPAEPVAQEEQAEAEESLAERGPFEPIQHDELAKADAQAQAQAKAEAEDGDAASAGRPAADLLEMPEFNPIGFETPDLLDLGPDDPVEGALGGLRSLYQTAEAIGPDRLERNLGRLLDRQRKLITDYFTEPGGPNQVDLDAPSVSVGFDSAESLAALRGELRTSR